MTATWNYVKYFEQLKMLNQRFGNIELSRVMLPTMLPTHQVYKTIHVKSTPLSNRSNSTL